MIAPSQTPAGEQYVHRIDELREEIRQAMVAISSNRLQAFEESLWRQEVLCTGLKQLLGTVQVNAPDSPISTRLRTSIKALFELNQSYAELLHQAKASNHLLYALCQGTRSSLRDVPPGTGGTCSLEA